MSKLASIVPPDLRDNPEIRTLLSGDGFSDAARTCCRTVWSSRR